jgi:hypothetical protein
MDDETEQLRQRAAAIRQRSYEILQRCEEADRQREDEAIERRFVEQRRFESGPPDPRDRRRWAEWLDYVAPCEPKTWGVPKAEPAPQQRADRDLATTLSELQREVLRLRQDIRHGDRLQFPGYRTSEVIDLPPWRGGGWDSGPCN